MGIYSLCSLRGYQGGDENMPRFDKTGPLGVGPMTGRGMGPCGGGYGYGRRGGYGWGRGSGGMCCSCWGQPVVVSDKGKVEYLKGEAEVLREDLKAVESELRKFKK
jgi:hypothetical protein